MANIIYSDKYSTNLKPHHPYKEPSETHHQTRDMPIDYGITNNNHISGIGKDKFINARPDIFINSEFLPGPGPGPTIRINLNNLDYATQKEKITNGYCYDHVTKMNELKDQIAKYTECINLNDEDYKQHEFCKNIPPLTLKNLLFKAEKALETETKSYEQGYTIEDDESYQRSVGCEEYFFNNFTELHDHIDKIPSSNIIPTNIPPLPTDTYDIKKHLGNCPDSQDFSQPYIVTLPDRADRPIYGTKRGIDVVGPRTIPNHVNINQPRAFDTKNSGYNINQTDQFRLEPQNIIYSNLYDLDIPQYDASGDEIGVVSDEIGIVDEVGVVDTTIDIPTGVQIVDDTTIDVTSDVHIGDGDVDCLFNSDKCSDGCCLIKKCNGNLKCIKYKTHYKSSTNVYNLECGTKNSMGTVSQRSEKNPQISEFVRNNIIGTNNKNINETSLYFRNQAKFNNKDMRSVDDNLNKLKLASQVNFIQNTNKLRTEVNDLYFKQQSHRIMNNLNNRGGF
jgi:hypothetical protein